MNLTETPAYAVFETGQPVKWNRRILPLPKGAGFGVMTGGQVTRVRERLELHTGEKIKPRDSRGKI